MTLLDIKITKAQFKVAAKAGIVGGSVFAEEINHHITALNNIAVTTNHKSYPAICKTLINKLNKLKVDAAEMKAQAEMNAQAEAKAKAEEDARKQAKFEADLAAVEVEAAKQGVPAHLFLLMPKPTVA
tara:strand:+ start:508 stop:891 length:384 start_codon:yes stop_codon:yes gene_type:complete